MSQSRAELIDKAFETVLTEVANFKSSVIPTDIVARAKLLRALCDVEAEYLQSLDIKQGLANDHGESWKGGEDE